jgi:hypothetical protein
MTLLGKVIQIDVSGASAVQPYVVLWDNPFVDLGGELPEIWGVGGTESVADGIRQRNWPVVDW